MLREALNQFYKEVHECISDDDAAWCLIEGLIESTQDDTQGYSVEIEDGMNPEQLIKVLNRYGFKAERVTAVLGSIDAIEVVI